MIPTRILGKLLRGKATPFQIALGAVLSAMLGFMPGVGQAPGLVALLFLLLLVLNANLFFAGLTAGVAKLVALAVQPAQFWTGQLLIDGPLSGLFKLLINAPVLAWFGFDNYVAVGGLVFGPIFGAGAAFVFLTIVRRFREKWASLEHDSDRYNKWTSKPYARAMCFVLIGGGHGKKSYEELLDKKIGNPIRPLGAAVAVIVIGFLVALQFLLMDSAATQLVRDQLERQNGATVDLERANVNLAGGKAILTGLAIADPADLARDRFRTDEMTIDFSTGDLLKRRYTIDSIVSEDAVQGGLRETPGQLTRGRPEPEPPEDEEAKTIEDYLEQYETWKERLEKLRDLLDRFRGKDDEAETPENAPRETLRERLAREAALRGHANVYATHLVEDVPKLTIKEIRVGTLRIEGQPRTYDINGAWLSTNPGLLTETAALDLGSSDDSVSAGVRIPSGSPAELKMTVIGLDADEIASSLSVTPPPFAGGTIDLAIDADLAGSWIEAPLMATLRDSTVQIPGAGPTRVDELVVPVRLRGPIDNPTIALEPSDLSDALVAAGKAEAARRLEGAIGDALGDKLPEEAGGMLDEIKKRTGGLGDLLPGGNKPGGG